MNCIIYVILYRYYNVVRAVMYSARVRHLSKYTKRRVIYSCLPRWCRDTHARRKDIDSWNYATEVYKPLSHHVCLFFYESYMPFMNEYYVQKFIYQEP